MRPALYLLLLLHVALLPFERLLRFVSDSGEDSILKPYRLVGILFTVLCLAWCLAGGRKIRLDLGDKSFLALFTLGGALALFWYVIEGNNLDYTIRGLQLISFGLALYIAIKNMRLTRREVEVVLVLYTTAQLVGVAVGPTLTGQVDDRLRGMYRNPNQLGIAVGVCLVFLFAQFALKPRSTMLGQGARAAICTALVAIIALSGSRGAAAGAAVGVLSVVALGLLKRAAMLSAPRLLGFSTLVALVVALGFGRFEEAWERTASPSRFEREVAAEGAEGRWELWESGINVGVQHYGIGVGTMQYLNYHLDSMRDLRIPTSSADRPLGTHSDYVDLFACYGVLGVWLFFRYIFWRGRQLARALRAAAAPDDSYFATLGLALMAAMLCFQVGQNSFQGSEYFLAMALVDSLGYSFDEVARSSVSAPKTVIDRKTALQHARPRTA